MKSIDLNLIYNHQNYRGYLAHQLLSPGKRGQLSRASESLGIQPSYLSRVINEEVHLTTEMSYKLCQFWSLSMDETEFFLKLVEFERSGDQKYKQYLENQISRMRRENLDISKISGRKNLSFEGYEKIYFSSWLYSSVHFLTAIPQLQTIKSLSTKLKLSEETIKEALLILKEMNFVENKGDRWIYLGGEFHLDKSSPYTRQNNLNWRFRAIANPLSKDTDIFYTHIYTISKKDKEYFVQRVKEFLAELNRLSGPSKSEEQVILNLDYFSPS